MMVQNFTSTQPETCDLPSKIWWHVPAGLRGPIVITVQPKRWCLAWQRCMSNPQQSLIVALVRIACVRDGGHDLISMPVTVDTFCEGWKLDSPTEPYWGIVLAQQALGWFDKSVQMQTDEVSVVDQACAHSPLMVPMPNQVNKTDGSTVSKFQI